MIRVLPPNLANMIAAGEVVGRPASVVKELVENSIDAGATEVKVIVTDAGRTLIQVTDNGCGMTPEEAELCFERHATSKIATQEDLEQILTFGFRGEALASIAAVAEVTLRTRRADDEMGTEVNISGLLHSSEPVSCPVGTTFMVRNLFYNTPARRKFLKSDNAELKHIIEEFTHVALTRPDVTFSLTHNGRDLFTLKKAKSLKFRIQELAGASVASDLVDVHSESSIVKISGFVGRPDSARKAPGNQYFFVNGRYFRSPYLHKAVMNAYAEMAPEGLTPPYFLYLEVDPHSVDVNISPTKSEVKFEDESVMFQVMFACVRETLGRSSFAATLDFDTEGAVQMPQISRSFEQYQPQSVAPDPSFDPFYNPFNETVGGYSAGSGMPVQHSGISEYSAPNHAAHQDYSALFPQQAPAARPSIVIGGKYILTPAKDGLMMVHVRRAMQRIIYERTLKALKSSEHTSQTAIFPVEVPVGVANMPVFQDNAPLLQQLGWELCPFSADSIVVNAVPQGYSLESESVRQAIYDLIPALAEGPSSISEMMDAAMAEKMAVVGAAHCQTVSDGASAQQLMDTLFKCENADFTPAGKRIAVVLSEQDIEKMF